MTVRNTDAPQRKSRLSYNPTKEELPFYESLFQVCDVNKTGRIVSYEEVHKILSLSGLANNVVKMIISMTINEGAQYLDRYQVFIAVRLVQLRQNRVSVKNLTLTVEDDVELNPPCFEGLNGIISVSQNSPTIEDTKQDGGSLSSSWDAKDREIEKLRRELKNAAIHVEVLQKENAKLHLKISELESSRNSGEENEMLQRTVIVNRENNFRDMGPGRDQMSRQTSFYTRDSQNQPSTVYNKDGSVGLRHARTVYDEHDKRTLQTSNHSRGVKSTYNPRKPPPAVQSRGINNLQNVVILPENFDVDDPEPTFDGEIPRALHTMRHDSLVSEITTSFSLRPKSHMTRNIDDCHDFSIPFEKKNGKINLRSMLIKRTKSIKSILTDKT